MGMFGNDRNNQAAPMADDQSNAPQDNQPPIVSELPADYVMTGEGDQQVPDGGGGDAYQVPVSINNTPPVPVEPADLVAIKQQALQDLSPIIDHLEQSPEERFHITMMMLQATDDQNLVKQAYEAARAITDEKKRAKALLDVVNEITYFTQQKEA